MLPVSVARSSSVLCFHTMGPMGGRVQCCDGLPVGMAASQARAAGPTGSLAWWAGLMEWLGHIGRAGHCGHGTGSSVA